MNQQLQHELVKRDAESSKQSSQIMTSILRGQANELRSRICIHNDKQTQKARVQTRVTSQKGSKDEKTADILLLEDLKSFLIHELADIGRAFAELSDDKQNHGVHLLTSDIQDFLTRPA